MKAFRSLLGLLPFLTIFACSSSDDAKTNSPGPPGSPGASDSTGASDGGGATNASGVAGDKSATDLTADDVSRLCDWMLSNSEKPGTVTKCPDGTDRMAKTKAECVNGLEKVRGLALPCSVTVADIEQCTREGEADACAAKPTCERIEACVKEATEK